MEVMEDYIPIMCQSFPPINACSVLHSSAPPVPGDVKTADQKQQSSIAFATKGKDEQRVQEANRGGDTPAMIASSGSCPLQEER